MVDTDEKTPQSEPVNGKRNSLLLKLTIALVVIGMIWFSYWFFYLRFHEYTDDAYLNGNKVNVNAVVPGSVVAYYADDTDFVEEGRLLVQLDETDYRIHYEKELVTLESVILQVKQLYANVDAAKAVVDSRKSMFLKAAYDFDNRAKLVETKAVSNQDYVHARDDKQIAEANLRQAQADLQAALDAVQGYIPEHHPLVEKQKSAVRTAFYNLKHCAIYAAASGYIAQRAVEVGQRVSSASNLMAIIPTDYVWVDANFKETQLQSMRIGQPATVWFDLYGGVEFQGKVWGIASGTGSVFSIIPPQNATGNWIKIVQRIPVRIALPIKELQKYPPRIGISAEVNVDIRDQELPYLTSQKPSHAVAKTQALNVDFTPIDKKMDEIIERLLRTL